MVKIVALTKFPYNDSRLRAGDEYHMPDKHARLLAALGKVRIVAETDIPVRVVTVDVPAAVIAQPRAKRQYRRRDMRAAG